MCECASTFYLLSAHVIATILFFIYVMHTQMKGNACCWTAYSKQQPHCYRWSYSSCVLIKNTIHQDNFYCVCTSVILLNKQERTCVFVCHHGHLSLVINTELSSEELHLLTLDCVLLILCY